MRTVIDHFVRDTEDQRMKCIINMNWGFYFCFLSFHNICIPPAVYKTEGIPREGKKMAAISEQKLSKEAEKMERTRDIAKDNI